MKITAQYDGHPHVVFFTEAELLLGQGWGLLDVSRSAPTHLTLPIPARKRAHLPKGMDQCYLLLAWNLIIKVLSLLIELTYSVVLCIELEAKQDMLDLTACAKLHVGNCLGRCLGNF